MDHGALPSNSKTVMPAASTLSNFTEGSQLWFMLPNGIRIVVRPIPVPFAGGYYSSYWQDKGRDCTASRHLPPTSVRHFVRAQTGVSCRGGSPRQIVRRWRRSLGTYASCVRYVER